jgi:hypothetical protein
MGARSVIAAALLAVIAGCGSAPLEPEGGSCPSQTSSAIGSCFPRSLDPVTDPTSPDFGRVPCRMFVVAPEDTGICSCDLPGYRPLGSIDLMTARQRFADIGYCSNKCCEGLCFCELLQLSGDDLLRCQAGIDEPTLDIPGFCYVEPDVGVGDPTTVEDCRPDERQFLRLTPDYVNYTVALACETGAH